MQNILNLLTELQKHIVTIAPQLTMALSILVFGIFVAYIFKWLSIYTFRGLSKIVPGHIVKKITSEEEIEKISKILGNIIFYISIFLTISTALKKLGLEIVSSWFQSIASYLPNAIAAIVIFIFGWKLKNFLEELLTKSLEQINYSQAKALSFSISWIVFILSIIIALEQIGLNVGLIIDLSVVLTGIIVGGIVLTFALGAKSNISDILSCYQINRHIKIGDEVTISNHTGFVQSIGPVFIIIEKNDEILTLPGNYFNKNITLIKKKKIN